MLRFLTLAFIMPLAGCIFDSERPTTRISGKTMGTTYNVVIVGGPVRRDDMAAQIEDVLANVNATMSNWDPNSEISRFNMSQSTAPIEISPEMVKLLQAGNIVHDRSEGKFDMTLSPLIDLWGFGARGPEDALPSDTAILRALSKVGQSTRLTLDADAGTLTKSAPEVQVALGAIAKGYGVDAVAEAIHDRGLNDYMVEIGGDLVTSGTNENGDPWQIGIEKPVATTKVLEHVISLSDMGMATSGDYRNYVEHGGTRYSHVLDPVTGRPITHRTTSVTVLADSAMLADAWATAMLALGAERGLQIAEAQGLAVYFISRAPEGADQDYVIEASSSFETLTQKD